MSDLQAALAALAENAGRSAESIARAVACTLVQASYPVVETDVGKPWGAYVRLSDSIADRFVEEFFAGLDPVEARLGHPSAPLSPKILIVSPGQRLSWQYHVRRAERWNFLTPGAYHRSDTNTVGPLTNADAGVVLQFARAERHRLASPSNHPVLVAEIWQHTDPVRLSDEADIVRLQDDYPR